MPYICSHCKGLLFSGGKHSSCPHCKKKTIGIWVAPQEENNKYFCPVCSKEKKQNEMASNLEYCKECEKPILAEKEVTQRIKEICDKEQEEFDPEKIKKEKESKVKKVEAEAKAAQDPTMEITKDKSGHYGVAKKKNTPAPVATETIIINHEPTAGATKKGRATFPIKDLKTGQTYPGMEAAKVANKIHVRLFDIKLENGEQRFVKA